MPILFPFGNDLQIRAIVADSLSIFTRDQSPNETAYAGLDIRRSLGEDLEAHPA